MIKTEINNFKKWAGKELTRERDEYSSQWSLSYNTKELKGTS